MSSGTAVLVKIRGFGLNKFNHMWISVSVSVLGIPTDTKLSRTRKTTTKNLQSLQ